MNLATIIIIIFFISLIEFVLIWVLSYVEIDDYTNFGNDVIWVSKNHTFNWFITNFFPAHAILYERLCERINGEGLALLLLLLTLITLPPSLLMALIGAITLSIRLLWRCFCRAFAREEDNK